MELGIDEAVLLSDVFTPPEHPDAEFVERYLAWDDARVIRTIVDSEGTKSGDVMRALVQRRLFKMLLTYDFEDLRREFGQPEAGFVAEPGSEVLRA